MIFPVKLNCWPDIYCGNGNR